MNLSKLKLIIKSRTVHFPHPHGWPRIGLPSFNGPPTIGLANRRIKWVILGSVGLSMTVVGVGIYFAIYDVMAHTYEWPRAGAAYADLPDGGTMGQELPQLADGTDDQTLAVVLAANTRLESLSLDLQMGKAGADCISIERAANTTGYLYADTFTMNGLVAPTLVMSNSEIHSMALSGFTDGHHTGPTVDSTIPLIEIGSDYGSSTYTATGRVDRLLITLMGDAIVKTVSITGKCSTGAVDLDYIKAGNLVLSNISIGDDGSIATAALDIDSSTKIYTISDTLSDKPIIVK
jgi:hypothetical protein